MQVRVHREAHARQHVAQARDVGDVETRGLRQLVPLADTALVVADAVVIGDPRDPRAAKFGVVGLGEDQRILLGNRPLIVETIFDPRLQLPPREFALMHQHVKRMLVVIGRLANRTQARDEFFGRVGFAFGHIVRARSHSVKSMPSSATSHPACSISRRSAEFSSRMGLVLLM